MVGACNNDRRHLRRVSNRHVCPFLDHPMRHARRRHIVGIELWRWLRALISKVRSRPAWFDQRATSLSTSHPLDMHATGDFDPLRVHPAEIIGEQCSDDRSNILRDTDPA